MKKLKQAIKQILSTAFFVKVNKPVELSPLLGSVLFTLFFGFINVERFIKYDETPSTVGLLISLASISVFSYRMYTKKVRYLESGLALMLVSFYPVLYIGQILVGASAYYPLLIWLAASLMVYSVRCHTVKISTAKTGQRRTKPVHLH